VESHLMAERFGWSHGALLRGPDAGETPAVPGEAACREPGTLGAPASCRPCRPRRIKKARRIPETTALCRDRLSGPLRGPDAGETPAVPGEAACREPGTLGAPASCRPCRPRRIKKARRIPEATALCRDRLSGPLRGPNAGETPAVPGGGLPKRLRFAESYPPPKIASGLSLTCSSCRSPATARSGFRCPPLSILCSTAPPARDAGLPPRPAGQAAGQTYAYRQPGFPSPWRMQDTVVEIFEVIE